MRFDRRLIAARGFGACLAVLLLAASARGQAVEGRIVEVRGDVQLQGAAGWQAAPMGARLASATLRTGADGQAQVAMSDGALLALAPASTLEWSAAQARTVQLHSGGLRLDASDAAGAWRVAMPDRSILTNGFLKLQPCAEACPAAPGLYGRVAQGEAVLEYQGGRSVLRNRSFRWPSATLRPEVLARAPAWLDDSGDLADAQRARVEVSELMRGGIQAFSDGNDDQARADFEKARALAPGEAVVDYYLGLVALRHDDPAGALRLLQQYARADPEAAASRGVGQTLTLLSSSQLQQEVATAIAREQEVVSAPPEPNSIAVNAFVNLGNEAYRAMAKGIAAMVIADLSKVPGLKVLEREKVQLLINEMKLGDAGLADPASAVRSGRLMRAEKVIVGNFEVK